MASPSGVSIVAVGTKLRDEALSAARALEEEAAALESSDTTRSQQLKEEAALLNSADAAQERVNAAAAALEQERAQANDLEQQVAALRSRLRSEDLRPNGTRDGDSQIDNNYSVISDTAADAHLHGQAAAVQNIRNLIPIVLDLQAPNYSKWRGYFLLVLSRFSLQAHVLSDVAHLNDPA
jgi:hypothetical protein